MVLPTQVGAAEERATAALAQAAADLASSSLFFQLQPVKTSTCYSVFVLLLFWGKDLASLASDAVNFGRPPPPQ
jgi:hypothetical protein